MTQPRLSLDALHRFGHGLARPESVHVYADGSLAVSHRGRGISMISPAGEVRTLGPSPAMAGGSELIPNGIALQADGSFLIANIGEGGGIWRLSAQGELTPYLMEVDGVALAAANFVMTDAQGRHFITVSTLSLPRFNAYSEEVRDGMILMVDAKGPRILADDICFANECRLTPDRRGLLVTETFARAVTRFDLDDQGLSNRRVCARFGRGDFPDGIRFDAAGYLWVTCIVSNRLWRIAPDGQKELVIEDCDPEWVQTVESALAAGHMGREHFYGTGKSTLGNIASIAFSHDGRTGYLGSLCGSSILTFATGQGAAQ